MLVFFPSAQFNYFILSGRPTHFIERSVLSRAWLISCPVRFKVAPLRSAVFSLPFVVVSVLLSAGNRSREGAPQLCGSSERPYGPRVGSVSVSGLVSVSAGRVSVSGRGRGRGRRESRCQCQPLSQGGRGMFSTSRGRGRETVAQSSPKSRPKSLSF